MKLQIKILNDVPFIFDKGQRIDFTLQPHTLRVIKFLLENWDELDDENLVEMSGIQKELTSIRLLGINLKEVITNYVTKQGKQMLLEHFNEGYAFRELATMHNFKSKDTVGLAIRKNILLIAYVLETIYKWDNLQKEF